MAGVAGIVAASAAGLAAMAKLKPAVWDPLMNKIVSSKDEKEISDALGEAVEVLVCLRKDYEIKVKSQLFQVPSESYQNWIHMVEKLENQAKTTLVKRDRRNKILDCAFMKRPASIREMQKLGKKVDELKEAGVGLELKLFVDAKLEPVFRNDETPDIKRFDTLQKPLEQILDLLKDENVYKLGIHGPLGVGKTTIMWNLNNHEDVAKVFNIVIWVKVSAEEGEANFSTECIQQAICRRLKLNLEGNNATEEVKRTISTVLSGKRYLLLLDDVKEAPNLMQIGIPDNKNGSKVVITTRLHDVCSLTVDRVIKVNYLSQNEAWKMFQDVMKQPKLIKDSKIGPLAWRVCKECGGLPLLVEKVASCFRLKNNQHQWVDGLNSWRMWPEKECQGIREMYNLFKFCYDDLDDDHQKKCFLYGALYPEDSEINSDYLIECWVAEDLLSEDYDKMKTPLMFAHLVLSRLKNVSLLEEARTENHVTMHKFIRQVALYIMEDDSEFNHLVKTNGALREPPHERLWLEKNRISLGENEFSKLPYTPNCRELHTLFLQKNQSLQEIPTLFFKHMMNLRVLDLSHTGIMSLPSSLSFLNRLKILYLNNCKHLKSLPTDIKNLVFLEALDIRGSGIGMIPSYIADLINLKRLRISFTESGRANATQGEQFIPNSSHIPSYMGNLINLRGFPAFFTKNESENASQEEFSYSTISNLSQLEELAIDVETLDQWSNEVVGNIINAVAPLKNFKTLKFFFPNKVVDVIDVAPTTLHIRVPEGTMLLSYITGSEWKNVQSINSFQFFIGSQSSEQPELVNFVRYDKYFKYCNGEGSNFPIEVLSEANAFELVNHKDIKQLSDIDIASLNNVQGCLVERCDTFETVVNATTEAVLPNLEHLYLKNLPKLRSIYEGSIQHGSLRKIKTLVLTSCHLLTEIFPSGVISQICEIEHLTIEDCPGVRELFNTVGSPDALPKLRKLKLLGNPELANICETNALNWTSLEKIKISMCPQLMKLPFSEVNATKLKAIKADQHWWDSLEFPNQETKGQLQKFCILRQ